MPRFLLVAALTVIAVGCAKKEEAPAVDTSAAMAVAPAPAPMPVAMTEADVAGTWTGWSKAEGSDSVVARWTQVCGAGSCKGTVEGSKEVVVSTYSVAGDSSIGTSTPHSQPGMKGKVVDNWVVHLKDGKAVGTQVTKLAGKDSVVARTVFEGTKAAK